VNWGTTVLLGRVLGGDRAATATLATAARRRVDSAPAGSGLQLAAARGLIQLTDDVDLLADWYAGATPDGLAVDAELGWLLLTHLCRRGARGDDAVEARLEQDRSTEGQVHAVRCRAAMPTEAAKEAAWRVLTSEADATNYQLYAVGEGFWWPEQQVLVAPYVPRYFAEIPGTAQLRSGWVVAETAAAAYPQYAVDSSTLVLADRLVSDEQVHASLRRAVSDAADSTRRALRARDRFSGS
jgi:aminopeptidase N